MELRGKRNYCAVKMCRHIVFYGFVMIVNWKSYFIARRGTRELNPCEWAGGVGGGAGVAQPLLGNGTYYFIWLRSELSNYSKTDTQMNPLCILHCSQMAVPMFFIISTFVTISFFTVHNKRTCFK